MASPPGSGRKGGDDGQKLRKRIFFTKRTTGAVFFEALPVLNLPLRTFDPSNLIEDDKLAIGKMKESNYTRVHPNMENPAHYNNQQLEFIRDREYNHFRMLDFTHVTEEMILSTNSFDLSKGDRKNKLASRRKETATQALHTS
eukprot:scaffold4905_cov158-Chaetoceros_neogracile.AAC.3